MYELSSVRDNFGRADLLRQWIDSGGIMIMGYEMYRNLSQCKRIRNKKQKKAFSETLVDPGRCACITVGDWEVFTVAKGRSRGGGGTGGTCPPLASLTV